MDDPTAMAKTDDDIQQAWAEVIQGLSPKQKDNSGRISQSISGHHKEKVPSLNKAAVILKHHVKIRNKEMAKMGRIGSLF